MTKEGYPQYSKGEKGQNTRTPLLAYAALSTLPFYAALGLHAHGPSAESDYNPVISHNFDQEHLEEKISADERVSELLENNYARMLIAATTSLGIASIYRAHLHGKKYHDKFMHGLEVTGPSVLTLASLTALIDSFVTIPRDIPAGLFLGYTLLQSGYNIQGVFERELDPKMRKAAVATSGALIAVGTTLLIASHNA